MRGTQQRNAKKKEGVVISKNRPKSLLQNERGPIWLSVRTKIFKNRFPFSAMEVRPNIRMKILLFLAFVALVSGDPLNQEENKKLQRECGRTYIS